MEINRKKIPLKKLSQLKKFLKNENEINFDEVRKKGWEALQLDEKNIFDLDALNLEAALYKEEIKKFFIVRSLDVIQLNNNVDALVIRSTAKNIEMFQKLDFELEVPLLTCLIFDEEITFLILRPDTYEYPMIYNGKQGFLKIATSSDGWLKPKDFDGH